MKNIDYQTKTYRVEPDFVLSPNGFGFRSDTGEVFRLNPTAVGALRWIEKGEDMGRVAQRLAHDHSIPLQRAKQDLFAFIEHMENLQLIKKDELE